MKPLVIAAVISVAFMGPTVESQTVTAAPAEAFLSWTVSPGTFAADCLQPGSVRWRAAVIIDPANPVPISPCFCAGDQQGFRLAYRSRGSGFKSVLGDPFDLFAESSCPARTDCP
jgi:hypothetical protein